MVIFEWLKKVNGKDLKKDPSLQRNQPRKGLIEIEEDLELDVGGSISKKELKIEIIKRF